MTECLRADMPRQPVVHVEAIRKGCPSVRLISPEYRGNGTVKFQNQNTKTTVYGASIDYFDRDGRVDAVVSRKQG